MREVTNDVVKVLSPLIDQSIFDAFHADLGELVQDAMMLWWSAQCSMVQFEVTVEGSCYGSQALWSLVS